MGINGFSQSLLMTALLAPVQAVVGWFIPINTTCSYVPPQRSRTLQRRPAPGRSATLIALPAKRSPINRIALTPFRAGAQAAPSRLKVIREFDHAVAPSCAGRMMISGRMADVCAELDRMAQHVATH